MVLSRGDGLLCSTLTWDTGQSLGEPGFSWHLSGPISRDQCEGPGAGPWAACEPLCRRRRTRRCSAALQSTESPGSSHKTLEKGCSSGRLQAPTGWWPHICRVSRSAPSHLTLSPNPLCPLGQPEHTGARGCGMGPALLPPPIGSLRVCSPESAGNGAGPWMPALPSEGALHLDPCAAPGQEPQCPWAPQAQGIQAELRAVQGAQRHSAHRSPEWGGLGLETRRGQRLTLQMLRPQKLRLSCTCDFTWGAKAAPGQAGVSRTWVPVSCQAIPTLC